MLYKSEIINACVCPSVEVGKYNMSIDMASLGHVGTIDLSLPTGIILYSGFRVVAHVKHAAHTFFTAALLCG